MDRRAFIALFATSAGAPWLSDIVAGQIQPGVLKIAAERIRHAAALAGLTWTEAEAQDVAEALSSFARHAEKIDKDALTELLAINAQLVKLWRTQQRQRQRRKR